MKKLEFNNKIFKFLNKQKVPIAVIILLFFSKFLGFLKNMFMAKYYGTSSISDAYQMAVSIPTIMLGIVLFSYQAFTKGYYLAEKKNRANKYTNSFINFILIIELIILILLILFKTKILKIFAPGFDLEQIKYTYHLIYPIIIGTSFLSIANILAEYLRCKNIYILPQVAYLIINIVEIVAIFIAFSKSFMWLSYGFLIANFLYFFMVIFIAYKNDFRYEIYISKIDINNFKNILFPVFLSSIIVDLSLMVDKIFASLYDTGTVSTLNYAANIQTVFLIIAAGFLTVLYPKIAKDVADEDYKKFELRIKKSLIFLTILYIFIILFLIFFSKTIVKIVYYRGAFNAEALIETTNSFIMYSIGILAIVIRDLYIKALYCLNKGNKVIITSVLSVFLNVIFNIILSKKIGYIGLPLATSLSNWAIIPLLIYFYISTLKEKVSVKP